MSCFTTMTAVTAGADLDLTKHVNYTAGMILGVDDFTQEFAYLSGRDRWMARETIGYGTVSGLSVRVEKDGAKGWRVWVAPGVAVSPRGQLICVSAAQCAYLNEWLAAAKPEDLDKWITGASASPPVSSPPFGNELTLYVVLCYRDCPTDNVPIPGEPCRNENELTAPSRIKDDFSLELRFEPPKQFEEDAVRNYIEWLRQIEVIETGASTLLEDFLQAIRDEWLAPSSPPITSPPTVLQISKDDICEYMRAAFRLWVTELRNFLSKKETGCAVEMTGGGKLEDCVLLAELRIPLVELSPGWKVSDSEEIENIQENRPFLLHLRMLQEWLLCGCACPVETTAPITSPPILSPPVTSPPVTSPPIISQPVTSPHVVVSPPVVIAHDHSLDSLSDVSVPAPSDGQILIFRNGEWVAEDPAAGGVTDHGALGGLSDDDHPQYLLVNGSRAMGGNLLMGGNQIRNIAAGTANGQAVIFQQAIKRNDAAGGDLGGKYPDPVIANLQGNPVKAETPNPGDALVWDGTSWNPQPQAPPETPPFTILPLATVTRVGTNSYEVWFNIDAPNNRTEITELRDEHLRILDETTIAPNFLDTVRYSPNQTTRNVFLLKLVLGQNQPEPDYMRFVFNGDTIMVKTSGGSLKLKDYALERNIRFAGSVKDSITVFARGARNLG